MTLNPLSSVFKARTKVGMLFLALLISVAFMLAACGGTASTQKTTVLSIVNGATGSWQQNFNPYSSTSFNQPGSRGMIYETLLFISQLDGKESPWLASSYQFSTDAKTLTFHLRPNIQWSDGKPFSSADVLFTLNMLKQYPALDSNGLWKTLSDVTAPDASTVVVTLLKPYSPIVWYLGGQTWIVPQHIWSTVGDPTKYTNANPVGTGPFTLKSFSNQLIDLGKNTKYWQPGKPQVTELRYPAYNSNTSAELALEQGQVDAANLFLPNLQQTYVNRDPSHRHYYFPPGYAVTLYLNLAKSPFNQLPVRQAISMTLDRQQLDKIGEGGYDPPASPTGLVLPAQQKYLSPDYANTSLNVDPSKAEQLLQSAGFTKGSDGIYADKNGKKLSFTLNVVSGFTDWLTDSQLMASELKKIGIDVNLNPLSFGAYFGGLQTGGYDAAIFFTNVGPSPFFAFDGFLNSKNTAPIGKSATSNFERWSDPATDALLNQYATSTDPAVQTQAMQGLEKIMVEQIPVISLVYGVHYSEYSTSHFTGWVDANNPYASPSLNDNPDTAVVVLNLKPV